MDVFYYWKKYEETVKDDMLGRFVSSKAQLEKIKSHSPEHIGAFIIPREQGGQPGRGDCKLKLLARLKRSDTALAGLKPTEKSQRRSMIYYGHKASDSILYEDTDSAEAVDTVTVLMKQRYLPAFRAHSEGANGVQVMKDVLVRKFHEEITVFQPPFFYLESPNPGHLNNGTDKAVLSSRLRDLGMLGKH